MKDITILIPAIRQYRWKALYESATLSCKKYSWDILLVGPFGIPEELGHLDNLKHLYDTSYVSTAVQRGMLQVESPLVFITVDDCTFREDALDKSIDEYLQKCTDKDVLNVRYSENGDIQPQEYYRARFHDTMRLDGVEENWYMAPQCILKKHRFIELGGFDCQFEYMNESIHDFMFRLQKDGGQVYHSSEHVCVATWYPNRTGDHAPIHDAQTTHDYPIFRDMYKQPNNRLMIDYDNWKATPTVWQRRFSNGLPKNYRDLVVNEGYKI